MELSERLENVAVVGAAGKMGSGISLLLVKEIARQAETGPATVALAGISDGKRTEIKDGLTAGGFVQP